MTRRGILFLGREDDVDMLLASLRWFRLGAKVSTLLKPGLAAPSTTHSAALRRAAFVCLEGVTVVDKASHRRRFWKSAEASYPASGFWKDFPFRIARAAQR